MVVIENDFYWIILKMKVTQDLYTIFYDLVGVGRGKIPRPPWSFLWGLGKIPFTMEINLQL